MGNSNGSLADYWAAFEQHHGLQGGFVWEWVDQGIRRVSPNGRAYWAYGGDFGDRPKDANFICDGLVWPDRTPHPALYEYKYLIQPVHIQLAYAAQGLLHLVNRQYFRGLEWLRGTWKVTVDGVSVRSGALPPLHAGPGERQTISVELAATAEMPGERLLTVRLFGREATAWAPAGHEVAWEQMALPSFARATVPAAVQQHVVTVEERPEAIVLRAGAVRAEFDRQTGALTFVGAGRRICCGAGRCCTSGAPRSTMTASSCSTFRAPPLRAGVRSGWMRSRTGCAASAWSRRMRERRRSKSSTRRRGATAGRTSRTCIATRSGPRVSCWSRTSCGWAAISRTSRAWAWS